MVRPSIRISLSLALIIAMTGCIGGFGPSDTNPTEESEINPGCTIIDDSADPTLWECPVSEYPPDFQIFNFHSEPHNVSVSVVRNNGSVVFSETDTFYPRSSNKSRPYVFEDVIDRPGLYTIRATVDNSSTDAVQWNVSETYQGVGEIDWLIKILSSGEASVERARAA